MQLNVDPEFVVGAIVDVKPGAALVKINPETGELYEREQSVRRYIMEALPGPIEELDEDNPGQVFVGGWMIHTSCLRVLRATKENG